MASMMLARNSRRHCLQRRCCPADVATMTMMIRQSLGAGAAVQSHRRSFAASSLDGLQKTALFDWHQKQGGGADMVPFAGYALPVLYKNLGVMKEHLWCREKASLFDVSHMGQIRWHGKDRAEFLEHVVVGDILGLASGSSCLSLITNETGGILDDTVITNAGDHIYMVVNGATKHDDMAHFQALLGSDAFVDKDIAMEYLGDDVQLLAVQGPAAAAVVTKLLDTNAIDLTKMPFMSGAEVTLAGIPGCRITRCGYTGEDGFELSMPTTEAVAVADQLVRDELVQVAGLGARDSLRLEAGLCLYGHDLDATTNPIEGALGWTLGPPKSRRRLQGGFLGAPHILTADGKFREVSRKRVGIAGMKAPAREHVEIYDAAGTTLIGTVTSGTFSPCLKKPIAMGYVATSQAKVGTPVMLNIRGKMQPAEVTKLPFVESRYYRVPEPPK